MNDKPVSNLLKLSEAADRLGVSHMTVWRMVQRGELPAVRVGRQYFIAPETVTVYLANNTTAPPLKISTPRGDR